jgi:hypothetical protein
MAYLGTPIDTQNQFQSLQGKRFSGDGSTTAFTLDIAPSSVFDIEVFVENVRQDPNSAYNLSGTTLTFTGAPPSGTNNIYVVHQAKAVGTINPPDASVNSDKLTGNLVTPGTLDVNGQELILDADADTSITADTDDQIDFKTGGTDRAAIDSSGNILVKKTAANDTDVGITLYNTGKASFTVAGDASIFNRTSDNGNVVLFRQAGTNCGSITSYNGNGIFISAPNTNGAALLFSNNAAPIYPAKKTDSGISISDDHVDLGASAHRFDDIHATNGTIQTSDQQEKNTITDSDLGLDFINRLSPKSYIFNGKTRTHYGLVAQDVETVLSEISKTSADFAGFIKTDISEKQDGSSYRYGLRYHEFIAPLIKAIKELKEENDSLKARVTTLEG